MYGNSLVNCSSCLTPLQVPTAAPSIRCALCHAITNIPVVDHRSAPHEGTRSLTAVPSPYNQAPGGPIPNLYGNKRAVICGISYRNSKQELKGCINDSKCMHYLLTNKFKFPDASIVMLNEEQNDPYRAPTRQNILMALHWLLNGCQPGDSLLFHFSGHGSQQRNLSGEEIDGYDETICPVDFQTAGMIVDDEINAMIVRPLPPGVKLHALIDACHSGTVLDLPYLCRMNTAGRYIWEDHRPRSGAWKGTSGGEAISFSGCDDNQTSADTSALSKVTSTGAMTYCFIQAIESGQAATYGDILTAMRTAIRSVGAPGRGSGGASSLMNMLVTGGSVAGGILKQEPQLTANETFDAYAKPFSL